MEQKEWDKLADKYHEEVISPFFGEVQNPLFDELKKIKNKNKKFVGEFGCGLFYLGEKLSKMFKQVHASDFSIEMVKKAKERNKQYININIIQEDIRKIKHKNKFDVIISVNSLLMPSFKDIDVSFQNLYNALNKNGTCFMILPSMEAVIYHGHLLLHEQLKKNDEATAKRVAKVKFELNKYDLFTGHYIDGKDKQKFYYKHGIMQFMKKAGFKDIEISKVKYPWGKDVSDYEDFPEEPRLWDWFVKARK
jgi:trans-aconitate methyltransferase